MSVRVLVAGVGNVLRCDDGFGVVAAQRLTAEGGLPPGVDIIETGIGGMSIVQQLLDGYSALIILDAVDRGAPPGTLFVLEPDVPAADEVAPGSPPWPAADLHLAEPGRVLFLARALGALPARVLIVGCQTGDVDALGEHLSPPVAAAVDRAVGQVRHLVRELTSSGSA